MPAALRHPSDNGPSSRGCQRPGVLLDLLPAVLGNPLLLCLKDASWRDSSFTAPRGVCSFLPVIQPREVSLQREPRKRRRRSVPKEHRRVSSPGAADEGGASLGLCPELKLLKLFHLGPRWDPKLLGPCLLDGRSVLVLILLQLRSGDVHRSQGELCVRDRCQSRAGDESWQAASRPVAEAVWEECLPQAPLCGGCQTGANMSKPCQLLLPPKKKCLPRGCVGSWSWRGPARKQGEGALDPKSLPLALTPPSRNASLAFGSICENIPLALTQADDIQRDLFVFKAQAG